MKTMEFACIVKLFESIQGVKRKYPILGTYLKHLNKLDKPEQEREVKMFRAYLLENPKVRERVLTVPTYIGTKKVCPIFFTSVLESNKPEVIENFWTNILSLEDIIFPAGRPDVEATTVDEPGIHPELLSNPILADILELARGTTILTDAQGMSISELTEKPDFAAIVSKVKTGLSSGKYKISDMSQMVNQVVSTMGGEMPDDAKETLKEVTSLIGEVERGGAPDLSGIMKKVGNLKLT